VRALAAEGLGPPRGEASAEPSALRALA